MSQFIDKKELISYLNLETILMWTVAVHIILFFVFNIHTWFCICTCFVCVFTGVQAFADALLIIIKVLAQNAGLDPQDSIVKLQEEYTGPQQAVGLDIKTGNLPNLHAVLRRQDIYMIFFISIQESLYKWQL